MSRYRLTERAEADLLSLFLDGLEWFGLRQARRYKTELEHCFQLLAENPQMGRLVESIGPAVRRHVHQSHVILHEIGDSGILILAIVPARSVRKLKL
ncbi:type II toxin-antitoxin system RelE/ParE family toxin [Ciceribacter sp. RN22]|uniref:type II toxin-antitoxin system RelE/ParE family toxin n=1 Tax=Ciceribacter sp. RN22 TaxID=2954932 RepID=UPI0020921BAC|nr:type II toxin-antitoxin system RelE/ParE family toxin [Ciceribacter sp. RN22]MCO6177530.1 type II toxin-antitoxin system RelE/ParE family toxin [Ciceribacter sp. RN22]